MTKKGDKSNLLIGSVKESSEVKPHTFILQFLKASQIYFIFMFCTWMGWGEGSYMCTFVWCTSHGTCADIRGQLCVVGYHFLPLCRFQALNSGC